jgi:hypothetical protein
LQTLDLWPMKRAEINSVPEFAVLLGLLRAERLDGVAWAVLGGVPVHYSKLGRRLLAGGGAGAAGGGGVARTVDAFFDEQLRSAISRLGEALTRPAPALALDAYRHASEAPEELMEGLEGPSPNKVLRKVAKGKATVYVPADAAIALVLRHRWRTAPTLDELRELCA